jgi:predicted transcriptional regulator
MSRARRPYQRLTVGWGPRRAVSAGCLSLDEVLVLRRKRAGMTREGIAADLGKTPGTVASHIRAARRRFGVDTLAELLTLPRVIELIEE